MKFNFNAVTNGMKKAAPVTGSALLVTAGTLCTAFGTKLVDKQADKITDEIVSKTSVKEPKKTTKK